VRTNLKRAAETSLGGTARFAGGNGLRRRSAAEEHEKQFAEG